MSEQRLQGVEIFATGKHRDREYTRKDLDDMVANFERSSSGASPRLRVPFVIGHSEDQILLHSSGLPAAGWVESVYREGDKLKADISDVPSQVSRLLRGKVIRKISAEVYPKPPQGIDGSGCVLRRVAGLGADVPQVKGLADIPVPEAHSERFADAPPWRVRFHSVAKLPDGCYAVFSEVGDQQMNREALMALLQQLGVDPSKVTDDVLGQIAAACGVGQQPQDFADDEELPDPKDDEEKAAFAERARKFADAANRRFLKYCDGQKMADYLADDDDSDDKGPDKMSEKNIDALVTAAVEKALAKHAGDVAEAKKFSEDFHASQKKLTIDAFCESRLAAGKILPAELDEHNPANLKRRLYRADSKAVVEKFSEGGKKLELTELDLQMREIDARPAAKFSERFKQPAGKQADADAEVEKVERFSEDPDFARALEMAGKTPHAYVEGFKAAKKANPKLTAREYGVPVE